MQIIPTKIPEVLLIKPKVHADERGYFFESFRKENLEEFLGEEVHFCQDNEAKSSKGVLRGLHYQLPPFAQAKLVRVTKGKVLDVVVDIRRGSSTFGKHITVGLSEENKFQLYIPKGFAHGYVVLEDDTIFSYKVDAYYNQPFDRGIQYNDQALNINWELPKQELIISEKDKKHPTLNKAEIFEFKK